MAFHLTARPIDVGALMETLRDARAGAGVTFEGRVRNENGGRRVEALEYEAYGPLAQKEGERIVAEAGARFRIVGAVCAHRTGRLGLGELAVWITVVAAHRDEAFAACRYIIDQTKARVPLWKKEHYADGASEWVNCASGPG
jgi:molybdopterin synthase catalytic subunit